MGVMDIPGWVSDLAVEINNDYELGLTNAGFKKLQRKLLRAHERAIRRMIKRTVLSFPGDADLELS